MKSIHSLLDEYQDIKSILYNRIVGMKQAFEEVMDDNDFEDVCLPSWGEELVGVSMVNQVIISEWESDDPEWATGTTWRVPVECFSMDREELYSFIEKVCKEKQESEEERILKRLKREAEDLGYKLEKV